MVIAGPVGARRPVVVAASEASPATAAQPLRAQRVTLPAFRQVVQTLSRFGVAPIFARTRWMLGFQRRFVRRCECEML